MASHRRAEISPTKLALCERRARVVKLYLSNMSQWEIAVQLGVNQGTVSRDLAAIQQDWIRSAQSDLDARRLKELAKIDELERQAWEAWEASKKTKETTLTEKMSGSGDGRLRASVTREQRDGNSAYLQNIQWCINKRCELNKLNPLRNVTIRGESEAPIRTETTITISAELQARLDFFANVYDRMAARETLLLDDAGGDRAEQPLDTGEDQGWPQ